MNMRFDYINPDILTAANLELDCQGIIDLAESFDTWKPSMAGGGKHKQRTNDHLYLSTDKRLKLVDNTIFKVVGSIYDEYLKTHPYLISTQDSGYDLLRYKKGQHYGFHTDQHPSSDVYSKRQVSIIIYLNDNFEGGETCFKHQNFKIKPVANSALVFPSGFCYPHASLPVEDGIKYCIVTWLTI